MKKYIFLSLSILCVVFIFSNSLASGDDSGSQSDTALRIIQDIISRAGISPALVSSYAVRKFAHFFQFLTLGLLASYTAKLWYGSLKSRVFMLSFFGIFIPVADEFIQIFIDGRVSSVEDIALDACGYFAGMAAVLVICGRRKCG
ncbi:MAG: VanZ family protein [Oscillospiraceae bacterium]|nr:VanZ family protein [Oscillospiraceae bacterium]